MPSGRTRGASALLVALLVVGPVACTDGRDTDSAAMTRDTVGGTMRLGIGGELVVDPAQASLASPTEMMVVDLLHDGLTRIDAKGVVQPALATGWSANEAQTAFRFQLDPQATFAGGRPITPQDVIASLERVIKAGDISLAALSLEAVTGFRAFVEGEAERVSGFSTPDEHTVRVSLETPLSVLPVMLSSPLLSVVDTETIDGNDLGALDLSGSWDVASADDATLVVERRKGAEGALDAVELHRYADQEAAYRAFADQAVDWAAVPSDRYEEAVDDYGDGAFAPFQAELFFGMNLSSPELDSKPLREAILRAIDREAIVEAVYADLADPLPTVVPAGVPGNDPDRCPACSYDPDAAADIVRYAFPDGKPPTINIDFDQSDAQEEMAVLVAGNLDAAGIPTKLRPLPLEEYKDFVVSGDQQLFSFGWIGAYASPDAYLAPLFGSAANDNLTNHRAARVDGLLDRARASENTVKNAQRWAAAESDVLEMAVVVPIAQFRTQIVVAERVDGFRTAVDGTVDWAEVSLVD